MTIQLQTKTARLVDVVTVEEAETLLQWIAAHPKGKVDLSRCTHLHTAVLQVLMALKPPVSAWPKDEALAAWVGPATNLI